MPVSSPPTFVKPRTPPTPVSKRSFSSMVDENPPSDDFLAKMPCLELPPCAKTNVEATVPLPGDSSPREGASVETAEPKHTPRRILPVSLFPPQPTEESGSVPSSQEMGSQASNSSLDMSVLSTLRQARDYIEKRLAREEERKEMADFSPVGSQNSNCVAYSQDSQLSGAEPPGIEVVAESILDTLPAMTLKKLFRCHENPDDRESVKNRIIELCGRDLQFFLVCVVESIHALNQACELAGSGPEVPSNAEEPVNPPVNHCPMEAETVVAA